VKRAGVLSVVFLAAIVAANWLTQRYHFVTVWPWPHIEATAGTFAAGVTFTVRDRIQDLAGRWVVAALIVAGAVLSAFVSPSLALASGAAFLCSEAADACVYTPLKSRSWDVAVWVSAVVGSVVDSVLFLWLAPFPVTVEAVVGQVIGKVVWATGATWLVLRRWR
jgi:uncharacterized PurR-regulated membrane protein YhhQ (DUF165 family)